jgi:hypothetical protein
MNCAAEKSDAISGAKVQKNPFLTIKVIVCQSLSVLPCKNMPIFITGFQRFSKSNDYADAIQEGQSGTLDKGSHIHVCTAMLIGNL